MCKSWRARRGTIIPSAAVILLSLSFGSAQSDLPEIPRAVLESLPLEVRSSVEGAYAELQRNPNLVDLSGQLAMVFHAHEQYGFAEQLYRRARELAPQAFEWAYLLATVQSLSGKSEESIRSYTEAIPLNPGYRPARLKLAEALFDSNQGEECRKLYREILEDYPELALVHYGLGRVEAELEELDSALEHLRRATELYPEYGPAHYALALAYRRKGEAEKAQQHFALYQKNRLRRPSVGDGLLDAVDELKGGERAAHQHLKKAVQLGEKKQLQESIEEHLRALELEPGLLKARVNLIILYGQTNQPEEAEKQYLKLVEMDANYPDAHYNYGVMLTDQGRYSEAAAAFRKTLQIDPFHAPAHNNLGQLLESQGKLEEATEHYGAAVEKDPSHRIARFNLGRMLVAQNRNLEAADEFLKILEPEDESTPRYMYALASAYVRAGRLQKALYYTQEARRRAEGLGQIELLTALDRDLQLLKEKLGQ